MSSSGVEEGKQANIQQTEHAAILPISNAPQPSPGPAEGKQDVIQKIIAGHGEEDAEIMRQAIAVQQADHATRIAEREAAHRKEQEEAAWKQAIADEKAEQEAILAARDAARRQEQANMLAAMVEDIKRKQARREAVPAHMRLTPRKPKPAPAPRVPTAEEYLSAALRSLEKLKDVPLKVRASYADLGLLPRPERIRRAA